MTFEQMTFVLITFKQFTWCLLTLNFGYLDYCGHGLCPECDEPEFTYFQGTRLFADFMLNLIVSSKEILFGDSWNEVSIYHFRLSWNRTKYFGCVRLCILVQVTWLGLSHRS